MHEKHHNTYNNVNMNASLILKINSPNQTIRRFRRSRLRASCWRRDPLLLVEAAMAVAAGRTHSCEGLGVRRRLHLCVWRAHLATRLSKNLCARWRPREPHAPERCARPTHVKRSPSDARCPLPSRVRRRTLATHAADRPTRASRDFAGRPRNCRPPRG